MTKITSLTCRNQGITVVLVTKRKKIDMIIKKSFINITTYVKYFQYALTGSVCFSGVLTVGTPLIYDNYEMDEGCYLFSKNRTGEIM